MLLLACFIGICLAMSQNTFTQDEKNQILQNHNDYRRRIAKGQEPRNSQGPASDMQEMEWDEEAATVARNYAISRCPNLVHNPNRNAQYAAAGGKHPDPLTGQLRLGENLAGGAGGPYTESISAVFLFTKAWFDEVGYRGGHYTQMAWSTSRWLGCGYAFCGRNLLLCCNYAPPGNNGRPQYTVGAAASACPAGFTNNDGLCRAPDWAALPGATGGNPPPPPPDGTTQPGGSTNAVTGPSATTSFPPPPPSPAPGAPANSNPPPGIYEGAPGARVMLRYFSVFSAYVSEGVYIQSAVETLRNTSAALFNVPVERFVPESLSPGSVIVNWMILDDGTPGSAAQAADSFMQRWAQSDPLIGQHQPVILNAEIVDRNARLGIGGTTGSASIGLIVGICLGILLVAALVVVIVLLVVRHRRSGGSWPSMPSFSSGRSSKKAPAIVSRKSRYEPLMSDEPLLYLSRNSRPSAERQMQLSALPVANLPIDDGTRALVLYDFDGSTAPNCLTVIKGEIVTVEDKSAAEWWDCRNASNELGFVPAKFLQMIENSPRGIGASSGSIPMLKRRMSASKAVPALAAAKKKPVPVPPAKKKPSNENATMILIDDFDGSDIPNSLTVFKGEEVTVLDKTNAEWWDCRNADGQVGFIPASFLSNVKSQHQQSPALGSPMVNRSTRKPEPMPKPAPQVVDFDVEPEEEYDVTVQQFDQTMEVSFQPQQQVAPKKFDPKKAAVPAPKPSALVKPAPTPGTPFIANYPYEPVTDTEIACRKNDPVIAPPGADLSGEWIYVKNQRTGKTGFLPKTFLRRV